MPIRRIAVMIAAVAAVTLTIAGCSSGSSSTSGGGDSTSTTKLTDAGGAVNVIVPTGTFQKVIEPLLQQFTKDTGVAVNETAKTIPDSQSAQLLDLTQKTGSYDAIIMDDTWLTQFKGSLLPLQALVKKDDVDVSGFAPELTKIFAQDGNQYAYPFGTAPWVLIYNSAALDDAGVSVPSTYAELKSAAAKLTTGKQYGFVAPLGDPGTLTTVWYQYAANAGQSGLLNKAGDKAAIDTDAGAAALTLYKDLYDAGSMPPGVVTYDQGTTLNAVESGQAAMGILPMSNLYDVNNPDNSALAGQFKMASSPVESKSDKAVYLTTGWGIGISKYSKNQANAWKLDKYLIDAFENPTDDSPPFIVKYPNSTKSLTTDAVEKTYPDGQIDIVKEASGSVVTRQVTPYYQSIAIAIGTDFQGVFTGKSTVKQALKQATTDVNKIVG